MTVVVPAGEPIHVELFGGPLVRAGETVVDLSPYQIALVTLVFAHGRSGISRPRIGWLLWEQDESPKVRHRIRQLLHRIHETVGAVIIEADGDHLRCASGQVQSDLDRYERLIQRRSLAEAAGLLTRGLATRLARCPSQEFEDWLLGRRRSMLADLRALASHRWDEASGAGLWGEARDATEALYMLFPEDLAVVEKLVEARARTGSTASAEEAFARYRDALRGEEVPGELVELIERVRRLRTATAIEISSSEPRAPLVGRAEAMADARPVFTRAMAGELPVVLITGEGGIGKTRVLEELKREALIEGFRCLHARPVEAEQRIPLNPLVDALAGVDLGPHLTALGEPWKAILGSFLPVGSITEPLEDVPPIQEAHLSRRLLDALRFLLQSLAEEEPTLLLIDDLQWADTTTVTALQFIQRRWNEAPLGIIATARRELIEPKSVAAKYLTRQEGLPVTGIELLELTHQEGHELVRHLVAPDVPETVIDRLCELAGLHPLYLTELAKDFAAGRLELPRIPADQVAIPVSLQEILSARVGRLSATASNLAGLLAVRGRPMGLRELAALTGLPIEHCADWVDELVRLRLVDFEHDRIRVAHELFRSALYRHLAEARRIVIHHAIAEHLSVQADDAVAGELAMHFAYAGDRRAAVEHGWVAAKRAMENGAVAEAAYFFELVADNEDDAGRQAEATAELARALHLGRSIGRANPLLELAAVRLRQIGKPILALRMDIRRVEGLAEEGAAEPGDLLHRLATIKEEARRLEDWEGLALALDTELRFAYHAADLVRVQQLLDDFKTIEEAGAGNASVLATSGLALGVLSGDPMAALSVVQGAVEQTKNQGHPYRLRLLNRYIVVLYHHGLLRSEWAMPVIKEARSLAARSGDLLERYSLESNLAVELLDSGYLDAAQAAFDSAGKLLGSADMAFSRVNHACNRGELALAMGRFEEARSQFLQADEFLGAAVPLYRSDFVNAGVGLCALEVGDLGEARRREQSLKPPPKRYYYDPGTVLRFKARALERRGEHAEALDMLDRAAQDLEGRLKPAWIKIRLLQATLARRRRLPYEAYAQEGLQLAKALDAAPRVAEFEAILASG